MNSELLYGDTDLGALVKYLFRYVSQGNMSRKETSKENELGDGINRTKRN